MDAFIREKKIMVPSASYLGTGTNKSIGWLDCICLTMTCILPYKLAWKHQWKKWSKLWIMTVVINPYIWKWQNIPCKLGQYHGCWCPGSLCHLVISSHGIDYIWWIGPCLLWGGIVTTCAISISRNDIKGKYILSFFRNITDTKS